MQLGECKKGDVVRLPDGTSGVVEERGDYIRALGGGMAFVPRASGGMVRVTVTRTADVGANVEVALLRPAPDEGRAVPRPASCHDCGLAYLDPGWCDCVVPDTVWREISPTGGEGGLLCFTCMARRLAQRGLVDAPLQVTSGPFAHDPAKAYDAGWNRGYSLGVGECARSAGGAAS